MESSLPRKQVLHARQTAVSRAGSLPEHAAAAQDGFALRTQLEGQLYQALSSSLWTYYVFVQMEQFSPDAPLISVHSALAATGLFTAAAAASCQQALVAELAGVMLQNVGVHRMHWCSLHA